MLIDIKKMKITTGNSMETEKLMKRVEDFGELKRIVFEILKMNIFDHLSKHDKIWNCTEDDTICDIMWDLRGQFIMIQETLGEMGDILYRDE
jgi:hypothetical protein